MSNSAADLHQNNLNAIRLLLAISVIFSHSYPLLRGPQTSDPRTHDFLFVLTLGQFDFAYWAVDCFFILSGFLILASWERSESWIDYLARRCLRIYPCFILASVFCAIVVAPPFAAHRASFVGDFDGWGFLRGMMTLAPPVLPPVFPDNPEHVIAGSLWTVQYEFGCYLTILLLAASCGRRLGTALAQKGRENERRGDHERASKRIANQLGWIFPILGGYLIFAFGFSRRLQLWRITRQQDWSYGTYCFAFPIQQCMVAWSGTRLSPWALFAAALPVTLVIAALSWNFVEHPALKLKKRLRFSTRIAHRRACASLDS